MWCFLLAFCSLLATRCYSSQSFRLLLLIRVILKGKVKVRPKLNRFTKAEKAGIVLAAEIKERN
jgi:hypothetical protein